MSASPLSHYRKLLGREESLLEGYNSLLAMMESRLPVLKSSELHEYRRREHDLIRAIEKTALIRTRFVLDTAPRCGTEAEEGERRIRGLRESLRLRIGRFGVLLRNRMAELSAEMSTLQRTYRTSRGESRTAVPLALDIRA